MPRSNVPSRLLVTLHRRVSRAPISYNQISESSAVTFDGDLFSNALLRHNSTRCKHLFSFHVHIRVGLGFFPRSSIKALESLSRHNTHHHVCLWEEVGKTDHYSFTKHYSFPSFFSFIRSFSQGKESLELHSRNGSKFGAYKAVPTFFPSLFFSQREEMQPRKSFFLSSDVSAQLIRGLVACTLNETGCFYDKNAFILV